LTTIEQAIIENTNLTHIDFVEIPLVVNGVLQKSRWPRAKAGCNVPSDTLLQQWMNA